MIGSRLRRLGVRRAGWIVLLGLGSAACRTPYREFEYCWRSDHHLAPKERLVDVDAPLDAVQGALREWARLRSAEIVRDVPRSGRRLTLAETSERDFEAARAIALSHWKALDANDVREWSEGELERLAKLSGAQIVEESAAVVGRTIAVRARERFVLGPARVVGRYGEPMIGFEFGWQFDPGWAGFGKQLDDQSRAITAQQATNVFSLVQFEIQPVGTATRVYASAVPALAPTPILPRYGARIGYVFWPELSARTEADLVEDAIEFARSRVRRRRGAGGGAGTDRAKRKGDLTVSSRAGVARRGRARNQPPR